jgi:hypothetical protein
MCFIKFVYVYMKNISRQAFLRFSTNDPEDFNQQLHMMSANDHRGFQPTTTAISKIPIDWKESDSTQHPTVAYLKNKVPSSHHWFLHFISPVAI